MRALALAIVAAALVACAAFSRDASTAASDLDRACALRAATRDAGPSVPVIVTNGCAPNASDAFVRCVGEAGAP